MNELNLTHSEETFNNEIEKNNNLNNNSFKLNDNTILKNNNNHNCDLFTQN